MTHGPATSSPVAHRRTMTLAMVVTGTALLAVLGWRFGPPGPSRAVTVDFQDVVPAGTQPATDTARPVLRVALAAMISPKSTKQYYYDLLRLIGAKVGRDVTFSQRRTYAEVNCLVQCQMVDIALVCSGPYVTGHDKFGMEILAVPVVHGKKTYHCYFLAGRDSSIQSLDDLKGKKFAFTDPRSNTGCLVPTYIIARRGYTPKSFFGEVFFSYSHDNSIKAVAEGLADGAAVDQLIWDFTNATDPIYTSRTRIVEKSPPYGIPPVVVHPNIDQELKRRLREAFLTLHQDAEAATFLDHLQIDRFEEGDDAMYDSVREMQRWLTVNKIEEE